MRFVAALLLAAAAIAAALLGPPALLEAWLAAFLLWAGLSTGALGALCIGHLLREDWLSPIRAPLEAAARTMPLLAPMALPVVAGLAALYPWAGATPPSLPEPRTAWLSPLPFTLRTAIFIALWSALALLVTGRGPSDKRIAALALALLLPTVTLAAQDWALSRDPSWWGSLQGFAVWVDGLMLALAAAALVALARREMPDAATGAGEALERALLALALTAAWLWFTQFIVVWMADLPEEAAWYLRRAEGGWLLLKLGLAVPALALAIALAAPPRHRPWRMAAVCALLLASHLANLWWVVKPDAPVASAPIWLDAVVLGVLGLAWALWWVAELRRVARPAPSPASPPAPSPATASAR